MNNDSQTAGTNPAASTAPAAPAVSAPAPAAPAATSAPADTTSQTSAPAAPAEAPGSFLTSGTAPGEQNPAASQNAPQGEPKADDPNAPKGAPEKYEFAAPEGMKFDDELLGEFSAIAKEKNLSQEEAQKFADMGAKVAEKTRAAYTKQIEDAQAQWVTQSRTDKEFGGDKLNENLAVAKRAVDTFGSPEFKAMLDSSGLGYHPEIIRAFYRVGKAISEDRFVNGSSKPAGAPSAQSLYDKSGMNP